MFTTKKINFYDFKKEENSNIDIFLNHLTMLSLQEGKIEHEFLFGLDNKVYPFVEYINQIEKTLSNFKNPELKNKIIENKIQYDIFDYNPIDKSLGLKNGYTFSWLKAEMNNPLIINSFELLFKTKIKILDDLKDIIVSNDPNDKLVFNRKQKTPIKNQLIDFVYKMDNHNLWRIFLQNIPGASIEISKALKTGEIDFNFKRSWFSEDEECKKIFNELLSYGVFSKQNIHEFHEIARDTCVEYIRKNNKIGINNLLNIVDKEKINEFLFEENDLTVFNLVNSKDTAETLIKHDLSRINQKGEHFVLSRCKFNTETALYVLEYEKYKKELVDLLKEIPKNDLEKSIHYSINRSGFHIKWIIFLNKLLNSAGLSVEFNNVLTDIVDNKITSIDGNDIKFESLIKEINELKENGLPLVCTNGFFSKIIKERSIGLKLLKRLEKEGLINHKDPAFLASFLGFNKHNTIITITQIFLNYLEKTFIIEDYLRVTKDNTPVWWNISNKQVYNQQMQEYMHNFNAKDLLKKSDYYNNFLTFFIDNGLFKIKDGMNYIADEYLSIIKKQNLLPELIKNLSLSDKMGNNILHYMFETSEYTSHGKQFEHAFLNKLEITDLEKILVQKNSNGKTPLDVFFEQSAAQRKKILLFLIESDVLKKVDFNLIDQDNKQLPMCLKIAEEITSTFPIKENYAKELVVLYFDKKLDKKTSFISKGIKI